MLPGISFFVIESRARHKKKKIIEEKEKINNGLLASENKLKQAELQKETALKASLNRENDLKSAQLKKERAIKTGLAAGVFLLLLSAGVILYL